MVTGAASGFGAGIAAKFVAEGARVLIADRDEAGGARRSPQRSGRTLRACGSTWPRPAPRRRCSTRAERSFGPVDILVNNAGVSHRPEALEDVTGDDFERIVGVNMRAIFYAAQAVVPRMKARRRGVILNIASTAGREPAAAAHLVQRQQGLGHHRDPLDGGRTWAPFGIRVVALNPVAGETPLLATFMGEDTPEMRARFLATIPLGRFSTPEDLGNAAAFVCSDEASMITGVGLEIDGGRCI